MNIKTFIATTAVTAMMSASAFAADIKVMDAWARASAGMANAGAAFMIIKNKGDSDTLVAAKADVSKRVELHTHTMVDGVMKMREVEGGIDIPGYGMQMLKPGSYHVMLMGLHAPLKEGTSFPLTLSFKSGYETTVDVQIKSPSAMGGMGHGNGEMGKKMGDEMKKQGEGMKHGH